MSTTLATLDLDAIALALGPDWRHDPLTDSNYAQSLTYVGADPDLRGAALVCLPKRHAERITWEADYIARLTPNGPGYDLRPLLMNAGQNPCITMRANTPAPKQAEHLRKRLLDSYLPCYAEGIHRLREQEVRRQDDDALALDLARRAWGDATAAKHVRFRDDHHTGSPADVTLPQAYGSLSIYQGHITPQLQRNLTEPQTHQLLDLIKAWAQD